VTESNFRSPMFALADDYVERACELSPIAGTHRGIDRDDDRLDDFSPAGAAAEELLVRGTLADLALIEPTDGIDRVGKAVMEERLTTRLGLLESGERRRTFGVLRSPASSIRQVFEIQPASEPQHAERIRARLTAVRPALDGWRQTLDEDSTAGLVPARRQTLAVAKQLETHATGAYTAIAHRTATSCGVDVESSGLAAAAGEAEKACAALAGWLRSVYAARAAEEDAVGAERYAPWARSYTGSELDLAELYEWGWEDLRAVNDRMWVIARQLAPGAQTLGAAAAVLDADDRRAVTGTDALLERLRGLTAGAVEMLDGVHFDIDERIRYCDARLAPEGAMAAPYYIGPSEDLSRPGTTWYPTLGHDRFPMWRLVSTWYHESVPGHHLQIGTALLERERQSRFQRVDAHVSGYSEGWALYAERLMHELGTFQDPGDELGYLSKQAMRAARVVVDIGMHLRLAVPDDVGTLGPFDGVAGTVWDAPLAVELLVERAMVARDRAESEVDRYLGTPGQAISYKVGERTWLECRADARRRLGDRFDLKAWHAHSLALGPMGLDPFAAEMARFGEPAG
jgi:uncharacterized protein (DUF885 family)